MDPDAVDELCSSDGSVDTREEGDDESDRSRTDGRVAHGGTDDPLVATLLLCIH